MTADAVSQTWPQFHPAVLLVPQNGVRDQGARGTCLAFALSAAHELRREDELLLSAEYLFWAAKRRDGMPTVDATTPQAIAASLEHDGQPEESVWPYSPNLAWPSPGHQPPAMTGITCYKRSARAGASLDLARQALAQRNAPVLAMSITQSFFHSDVIDYVPSETIQAWHAVLGVGYGSAATGEMFVIKNSWGEAWGTGGHALISAKYLTHHLRAVLTLA